MLGCTVNHSGGKYAGVHSESQWCHMTQGSVSPWKGRRVSDGWLLAVKTLFPGLLASRRILGRASGRVEKTNPGT